MKIDFSTIVKDIHGNPMVMPPVRGQAAHEASLGDLCIQALLGEYPGEALSGEDKFSRYSLALSIKNGAEEVTAEQVVLLKEVVGRGYAAGVVGPVYNLLEGK